MAKLTLNVGKGVVGDGNGLSVGSGVGKSVGCSGGEGEDGKDVGELHVCELLVA